MTRKIIIASIPLVLILGIGVVVWYGLSRQSQIVSPKPEVKEYNIYVSKYGFSVSYPAKWYLLENWRETEIPESRKGWLAFTIANKDPMFYIPRGGDSIEIFFGDFVDDLKNAPSDIESKLEYFARKHGMRSIDELKILKMESNKLCLAYGMPRGYSDRYYALFFYLPKSKKIASAIIYSSGTYSIKELLEVISIKIER